MNNSISGNMMTVVLSSFSFLLAFILRDTVQKVWENLLKYDRLGNFWKFVLLQITLFGFIFSIVVITSVYWKDTERSPCIPHSVTAHPVPVTQPPDLVHHGT